MIVFAYFGPDYSPTGSIFKLIGLILLCIIIIAASYYTTKFVGKRQSGQLKDSNFQTIEVFRISPNKYLQLVRAGEKYLVLAVCKDNITLVAELTEDQIKFRNEDTKKKTFKEILASINSHSENKNAENEKNE